MLTAPGADPEKTRILTAPSAEGPGFSLLDEPPAEGAYLYLTAERLELRPGAADMHPLYVDFNDAAVQRRAHAGRRDGLARALGLHRRPGRTVLDATCGLGRDAGVLLALGCGVVACERSPVMRALLRDGLERAASAPPAADRLARWRGLHAGDARAWLAEGLPADVEVVYIDPMFGGTGRRALPKREMQILRAAVGEDSDAGELLGAARAAGAPRTVVKRHPRHTPLAAPDYSLDGKRVSFDVYLGE